MSKEIENKVDELKEELKNDKTEEIICEEGGKVKKVITYCLKGLALVATGVVGFFIGRGISGKDEDNTQEEKTTEE